MFGYPFEWKSLRAKWNSLCCEDHNTNISIVLWCPLRDIFPELFQCARLERDFLGYNSRRIGGVSSSCKGGSMKSVSNRSCLDTSFFWMQNENANQMDIWP